MTKKFKGAIVALVVIVVGGAAVWLTNSYWYKGDIGSYQMGRDYSGTVAMDSEEGAYYMPSAAPMMSDKSFAMSEESYSANNSDGSAESVSERLIIKTGQVSMVVDDVRAAVKAVSDYAVSKGGFVVSSSISKEDIALYGEVTVRIPAEIFDEGIQEVKGMGEVESEMTWGQDVTEEYVDLGARLENLRATESQFLEIMKKATDVEDILAVQRELTWVRQDIESIEGRMKYLSESADLSTLSVYLSTDPSVLPVVDQEETWKPFAVLKNALRSLLDFGKSLVNGLIWVVIYIPAIAVVLVVLWVVYRVGRRIFKGKKKKK
ncbi:MAG: DUF4349 domain-containing protein [Candidatus Peregrinibacteria bacterium]